jgi:flagellar biosynthesis/type III secretory pathway M-ring protein FliF/YscJ
MTETFLVISFAAIVIYIFWVLLNPRKKKSQKKPAKKQISKKNRPALKEKENKQQAALSSAYKIRKEKTNQMKKDPELIGHVIRHWLREK